MTEQAQVVAVNRPPLHLLLMGESGVGKDSFAATWPKPMLVWHLDGYGQEMPYMKGAISVSEIQQYQLGASGLMIPYRDIVRPDGFVRIEYYSSDNPEMPNAVAMLTARMSYFASEVSQWCTLAVGSLSSISLEARLYEQFVLNPQYKDPRKWFGAATDCLERLIALQKGFPINVVMMCHVARQMDEVDGAMLYTPDLPGRLSYGAARYFNEMYRMYVAKLPDGKTQRSLQTDNDGKYQAKTHIDAPSPCWPTYDSLWANWR